MDEGLLPVSTSYDQNCGSHVYRSETSNDDDEDHQQADAHDGRIPHTHHLSPADPTQRASMSPVMTAKSPPTLVQRTHEGGPGRSHSR
jgi:hypothetical protein